MQLNETRPSQYIVDGNGVEFKTYIEELTLLEVKDRGPVTFGHNHKMPRTMEVVWNPLLDDFCLPLLDVAPKPGWYKVFIPADGGNLTYGQLMDDPDKPDGWPVVNSSVLAQTVLGFFQEIGVRILSGHWVRVSDGGWTRVLPSGIKQTYHMRLGGDKDGNIQVDYHYADEKYDPNTSQARRQQITSE